MEVVEEKTMLIELHDSDKTKFPNLALMKLSAFHKSRGDIVEWFNPMFQYDKIYSSKVFTFTLEDPYLPVAAIRGGTGYNNNVKLPVAAEHICPDYGLYGNSFSVGFLTRGCNRTCEWCVVPSNEGKVAAYADIDEFAQHNEVVLLDNNVLQCEHGIE